MKINYKSLAVVMLPTLTIGIFLGWLIFSDPTNTPLDKAVSEIGHKKSVWTCSMHPQIRQPEAGKCPLCGMDLIPLENEAEDTLDSNAIRMSSAAIQLADIETIVLNKTLPVRSLRLNGKIQADERLMFSQSSHIPGRIEKLMVNFTGEFIKKGQIIAQIYAPDLITAQEELLEAEKIRESQPQLFKAVKEKLRSWKISEDQIEQILTKSKPIELFDILADVSGYVVQKKVSLGDYIRKGEAILQITDLSKVWVLFDMYESDMGWAKRGDKISFTIQSFPGETFESVISYIDPVIDSKSRVARVRVEVMNKEFKFKPEMFASGLLESVNSAGKTKVIIVPKSAVMWTGKRSVVYIKSSTNKGTNFRMQEVVLGTSLGDGFVVESGLKEGVEIAVKGTFSIDAAAQLAGKPSMMNSDLRDNRVIKDSEGKGKNLSNSEDGDKVDKSKRKLVLTKEAQQALHPLYNTYIKLKDIMISNDFSNSKKQADVMNLELSKIPAKLFKGESKKVWVVFHSRLNGIFAKKSNFETMENLQKVLSEISNIMIELTIVFKPYHQKLYRQHCPMANEDKGADWLSLSEAIENPYFGGDMLKCGKVVEVIEVIE